MLILTHASMYICTIVHLKSKYHLPFNHKHSVSFPVRESYVRDQTFSELLQSSKIFNETFHLTHGDLVEYREEADGRRHPGADGEQLEHEPHVPVVVVDVVQVSQQLLVRFGLIAWVIV